MLEANFIEQWPALLDHNPLYKKELDPLSLSDRTNTELNAN